MQVDLQSINIAQTYRSQVCIIGGGIAGLTLASSLSRTNLQVHLLEAGDLSYDEQSQGLYHAEITGHRHLGTTSGRFRVFGGSSSRWGAQILPFTEDVLQPPAVLNLPSWPIQLEEIAPFYNEIQSLLGTNCRPFSEELLATFGQMQPFQSDDIRLRYSKWAPFSKRNLAKTLGQVCCTARNISVFLNANVTQLHMRESGTSVKSAAVTTFTGLTHEFTADLYILCTGTIEVSRLLLSSTSICASGIGNDHDQVGRYFHDHVGIEAATLPAATKLSAMRYFIPRLSQGTLHTPKLEATTKLRADKKLLSVMAHFPIEEPSGSGLDSIRLLLQRIQARQLDRIAFTAAFKVPAQSAQIVESLWTAYVLKKRPITKNAKVTLHLDCEQNPKPESRILLSSKRDRLGSQRAAVHWIVSEDEHRTMKAYALTLTHVFEKSGLGRIDWRPELFRDDDRWLELATDTFHMMGGTRMGTDPKESVVDRNLRVHGVGNLFVASCSVFPTGGSSNPTFSMMALTLRLARQICHSMI